MLTKLVIESRGVETSISAKHGLMMAGAKLWILALVVEVPHGSLFKLAHNITCLGSQELTISLVTLLSAMGRFISANPTLTQDGAAHTIPLHLMALMPGSSSVMPLL